jgi:hypothetical protein
VETDPQLLASDRSRQHQYLGAWIAPAIFAKLLMRLSDLSGRWFASWLLDSDSHGVYSAPDCFG